MEEVLGLLLNGVIGGIQTSQGSTDAERPTSQVPTAAMQALNMQKMKAYGHMPGLSDMMGTIGEEGATAYSNAAKMSPDPSANAGTLSTILSQVLKAKTNVGITDAGWVDQQNDKYSDMLTNIIAPYQKQNWQYNEAMKYQEKQQQQTAGLTNITGAVNAFTKGTDTKKANENNMAFLMKLLGGNSGPAGGQQVGQPASVNSFSKGITSANLLSLLGIGGSGDDNLGAAQNPGGTQISLTPNSNSIWG